MRDFSDMFAEVTHQFAPLQRVQFSRQRHHDFVNHAGIFAQCPLAAVNPFFVLGRDYPASGL
ncbi:MAG: hypothetical protein HC808_19630 [Candidatus Competibacteraceae bacterium]|nr:hypothetical protein [Candidatus Competibacteraceae bacterium]